MNTVTSTDAKRTLGSFFSDNSVTGTTTRRIAHNRTQSEVITDTDTKRVAGRMEQSSVVTATETRTVAVKSPQDSFLFGYGAQGIPGPQGVEGPTGGETTPLSVQNMEAVDLTIGTPVRISALGQVLRLSAAETYACYALVLDSSIAAGGYGLVSNGDFLTATTAEWDAITLGSGGLTPGQPYYASTTPGKITASPSLSAASLILIGFAVNATKLRAAFDNPVLL